MCHPVVRVGMGTPESIVGLEEQLAECMDKPYIYKFIHLPV